MSHQACALGLVVAVLATGCGHSQPFSPAEPDGGSPFADLVPRRLTYDDGADIHPHWTGDGRALLYTFERQLPGAEYPDRCLGALPSDGGQRLHEWCWPTWDEGTRRDGIETGMVSGDGRLFFVHLYGAGEKQPNPHKGSAYLAPVGDIGSPTRLFDLLVSHPGASARWDHFLAPVFTGPAEVTGLATAMAVEQRCPACTWDTVYTGLDLVRVPLDDPGAMVVLARIGRAAFLSWDASVGRFFFARDGRIETLPTRGGEPTLVWQVPRSPNRAASAITGLAAAAGRVVVSYRWTEGSQEQFLLGVLDARGEVQLIDRSADFPRWGELALSPDGRRLAVERLDESGARDLYLYELP